MSFTKPYSNPCAQHKAAPTFTTCGAINLKEPAGWKTAAFNASAWSNASLYTAAEVGVRDGYNTIA